MSGEEKELPSELEKQLKAMDNNIELIAETIREIERRLEKIMVEDNFPKEAEAAEKQNILSPVSTHLRSCNERLETNRGYLVNILKRLDV